MNKKERPVWPIIGMLYLAAIGIGTLIGTLAYSAVVAFLGIHAALGFLLKIGTTILQVLT
jgi:hypothetical protein